TSQAKPAWLASCASFAQRSRTSVSLWFSATPPALTPVWTFRPLGWAFAWTVRTSTSLWLAHRSPALTLVFTFMIRSPLVFAWKRWLPTTGFQRFRVGRQPRGQSLPIPAGDTALSIVPYSGHCQNVADPDMFFKKFFLQIVTSSAPGH